MFAPVLKDAKENLYSARVTFDSNAGKGSEKNIAIEAVFQAIIDGLGVRERIVFMGHSRGGENAIHMSIHNTDRTLGTVMINPFGLRLHKGVNPFYVVENVKYYHETYPFLRAPIEWIMYKYYNKIGLRLSHGKIAISAIKTMHSIAFEESGEFMGKHNSASHLRFLFLYAGKDFLIETDISWELAEMVADREHLDVKTRAEPEETAAIETMKKSFSAGRRRVTAEFAEDGHFLQKHRARFIVEGTAAIFQASTPEKPKI